MRGGGSASAPRYLALWVPNWELSSLVVDVLPGAPAAVVERLRIQVVTPAAGACGVKVGMSQVMAQYCCPELLLFPPDPNRESMAFEAILKVLDDYVPEVFVVRPGLAFASAYGPAKWAGGEDALAGELIEQVALQTSAECQVGIADTLTGALLASRRGLIIPPGKTRSFLDSHLLEEVVEDLPPRSKASAVKELPILKALGVHDVGNLRNLGAPAVIARFGASGQILWNLICGREMAAQASSRVDSEVVAEVELDPPALLVDQAVVAVRRVANNLSDALVHRGLYSSTIRVSVEKIGGGVSERTWTLLDAMSPSQVGKRITWQLRGMSDGSPSSLDVGEEQGIERIRVTALHPVYIPESDPLWGGGQTRRKAGQAVEEVQALLGENSAVTPIIQGGFDPRSRTFFTSWGGEQNLVGSERNGLTPRKGEWDGAVNALPIVLFSAPPTALLMGQRVDGTLGRIWVNRRGVLNGNPTTLIVSCDHPELEAGDYPLSGVRGLWMVRGRWWKPDSAEHSPRCYLRVIRRKYPDLLLVQRGSQWWVEGIYPLNEIAPLNSPTEEKWQNCIFATEQ